SDVETNASVIPEGNGLTVQQPTQPTTPQSKIPLDDKGQKDYTKAPVEDTIADITAQFNGNQESANAVIKSMADQANADLDAAKKKKEKGPKGKNVEEIAKNQQELENAVADAQAKADYWNGVLDKITPENPPAEDNTLQPPTQDLQPPTQTKPAEYHKLPIEETIKKLYGSKLDDNEINDFVSHNIKKSFKELEAIKAKKPKMDDKAIDGDIDKYAAAKEQWQQQVNEAQQKTDYWHNVEQYIQQQTHTTDAELKAVQDELSGANAQTEFAAQNSDEAKTPVQVAGEFIKDAKLLSDDFRKETGLSRKEELQFPGMFSKGGKTIAQLAEDLVSHDNDTYNGMFFKGDDMAAKDAIIEALQTSGGRASLGQNTSAEFKAFDRERTQQREDFYEEAYHMSYSDYLAFEEQQMPSIWRLISNFAPEQYDQYVAEYYESLPEDYFTHQNNKENGTEQQDPTVAGSDEILPQSQVDNETGTGQRQDPSTEEGNGGKGDNPNDEVSGGAQQLNNQTGEQQGQWNTLSEEEAKAIIQNMEDSAEEYVETELSPESWNNSFDENNSIQTPIGRVKMGDNQISKFLQKKRTKEFGMVAPTLSNPDVIVEERSEAKDGNSERATSYIFIKTFNRNGEKIKFYASITVKKDGMEVSISSHYMNKNAVEKRLMEDNVIYVKDSLLPNSSDMHLAENPNGLPDLLPTQGSNESISGDKDTTKSPNSQENQQKVEEKVEEQQKDEINAAIKNDI
ncbi:MAG: PBECR2 nuclease fold domain-containing protein, partial [Prevotella sp.]